jgi:hypothetical protein
MKPALSTLVVFDPSFSLSIETCYLLLVEVLVEEFIGPSSVKVCRY